jgi:putative ABC transport system substrate-binding protein
MRRREFISFFGGGLAAWPIAARAQQPERVRRIGVLAGFAEHDPEIKRRLAAFRQNLEKRGWLESKNIRIDVRYAPAGFPPQALANELVALDPDVIFANSTPMARAIQRATQTIPIVFVAVSDPIGSGFIASLARPGGNLTGLLLTEEGIAGKWLAMLKEIDPRLKRAMLLANPKTTPFQYFARSATAAGSALAIEVIPKAVETAADIENEIEAFARGPSGGLILPPDSTITSHRDLVVRLAAQNRLPAISALRVYVTAGGLMSYGTDRVSEFGQAADYVDRILRGEKPADLPVQAPTKYETAVNLKTAKALGLTVPPTLLAVTDEVIE